MKSGRSWPRPAWEKPCTPATTTSPVASVGIYAASRLWSAGVAPDVALSQTPLPSSANPTVTIPHFKIRASNLRFAMSSPKQASSPAHCVLTSV